MKRNATLLQCAALLAFSCLFGTARAQYCQPTFAMGCSLWGTQTVNLTTLSWATTSFPCTDFDYTWLQANLTTGIPHQMTVTNGDWCGCAVWIDFNQDSIFQDTENQFYSYQAFQDNTYTIYLTIPNGTQVGMYRMRIISPWGSDGFLTTNVNGYGSCGAYQYGNFQDFTVNVTGPAGVDELAGNGNSYMSASLNRENNEVTVAIRDQQPENAMLQLTDISGRVVDRVKVTSTKEILNVAALPSGIYILNYTDGTHRQSIKLVK